MAPPKAHDEPPKPPSNRGGSELESLARALRLKDTGGHDDRGESFRLKGLAEPGRLIDCLAGTRGSGAGLAALWFCLEACRSGGELVVIDPHGNFYPPAAIAWGVAAERLLVVSPASDRDALVAAELALRSDAVAAVWASLDRIDRTAFQRLLLAARSGGTCGALVRSMQRQRDPSFADVQLRFDPLVGRQHPDQPFVVRVTRLRNRHGPAEGFSWLSMDWRNGKIDELADGDGLTRTTTPAQRVAS